MENQKEILLLKKQLAVCVGVMNNSYAPRELAICSKSCYGEILSQLKKLGVRYTIVKSGAVYSVSQE